LIVLLFYRVTVDKARLFTFVNNKNNNKCYVIIKVLVIYGMDTGRFFNQKEVINCTQLTRHQLKTLESNGLIDPNYNPLRYSLKEVVYCRMLYRLREIYSLYQLKRMVLSVDKYGVDILTKKYGVIKQVDGIINQLELLDSCPDEVIDKLQKSYCFSETKKMKDKFTEDYLDVEWCYVDLEGIRVEVIDRGYRYGVTSLTEKFA